MRQGRPLRRGHGSGFSLLHDKFAVALLRIRVGLEHDDGDGTAQRRAHVVIDDRVVGGSVAGRDQVEGVAFGHGDVIRLDPVQGVPRIAADVHAVPDPADLSALLVGRSLGETRSKVSPSATATLYVWIPYRVFLGLPPMYTRSQIPPIGCRATGMLILAFTKKMRTRSPGLASRT